MKIELTDIKSKLNDHGLKVTHQRLVVYRALLENQNHPGAETIYSQIKDENPSISLGTVYKILESFVEAGLINRIFTAGKMMRYDAHTESHNHIYCNSTGEIIDFVDDELDLLLRRYFEKKQISNFNVSNIRLHIRGEKIEPDKKVIIS